MLALFGIPRAALPDIKPSSGLFGHTKGLAAIPDGIPIMSMIGDSHAALFGHALGEAGCVKATYGTGSSVMARSNRRSAISTRWRPPSPGTMATSWCGAWKGIFPTPAMLSPGWRTAPD
ncbi:putative carbohydrate kinase [Klebsiella pneumoniae]|nr:putative carbohydrate kinase [Klebsiella pneumoniae]